MVKSASHNVLRVAAASKFRGDRVTNVSAEVQEVVIEGVPDGHPTDNFAIDFNQKEVGWDPPFRQIFAACFASDSFKDFIPGP